MQHAATRHASTLLFGVVVAAVYAAGVAVAGRLPRLEQATVVAAALTIDLVVLVPLAFYLLVVRRRGLPLIALAPVLVLSVLGASRVLPPDRQQLLRWFEVLAVPVELAMVGWIAWRAARSLRRARRDASADPLEQLRRAALELTRHDRVAEVFASEIGVLFYGIGAWRARPHVPAGWSAVTHHSAGGQAAIVLGFLLVLATEGFAVHVLLLEWNGLVAWLFTLGTAYGALWLIADYRATVLRPILVGADEVVVRAGLRFTLRVPRERIAAIEGDKPEAGKESANLTLLGTPTRWLLLSEPMRALGPYGFRSRVRAVGLRPDDTKGFDRLLASPPALRPSPGTTRPPYPESATSGRD